MQTKEQAANWWIDISHRHNCHKLEAAENSVFRQGFINRGYWSSMARNLQQVYDRSKCCSNTVPQKAICLSNILAKRWLHSCAVVVYKISYSQLQLQTLRGTWNKKKGKIKKSWQIKRKTVSSNIKPISHLFFTPCSYKVHGPVRPSSLKFTKSYDAAWLLHNTADTMQSLIYW